MIAGVLITEVGAVDTAAADDDDGTPPLAGPVVAIILFLFLLFTVIVIDSVSGTSRKYVYISLAFVGVFQTSCPLLLVCLLQFIM